MHYYQFNIADYRKDTAHLTLIEHAIYRQLLDWYYLDEKPIPTETQWVIRRFNIPYEQVETILKEFFDLRSDGWHHDRCDIEINNYQHNAEKNRINGKLGGRPKKTQSVNLANPTLTQTKPTGNPSESQPRTINQEPVTIESTTLSGKPDVVLANGKQKFKQDAEAILDFLNTKTGSRYKPVVANLEMIAARLKEGATADECRQVIAKKCRDWGGDEKMAEYLRPKTLFNRTNFANYQGELG